MRSFTVAGFSLFKGQMCFQLSFEQHIMLGMSFEQHNARSQNVFWVTFNEIYYKL